ncbi:MAG: hypothetical protein ACRCYY_21190 [Trueperaceae bacterium]
MIDANFKHKTQLIQRIRSSCASWNVTADFIQPRRTTDRFVLVLKGKRENVAKVHLEMLGYLQGDEIELVAVRDRETGYVMGFVIMEKTEEQSPYFSERRSNLQDVYKTIVSS